MPNRHVQAAAPGLPKGHLHLVSSIPDPEPEQWEDRPRHTLLHFTLSQREIERAFSGVTSLLWANTRMLQALEAARAGDEALAQKHMDRAFSEMIHGNAHAEAVYAAVRRSAVRAKPRKARS